MKISFLYTLNNIDTGARSRNCVGKLLGCFITFSESGFKMVIKTWRKFKIEVQSVVRYRP